MSPIGDISIDAIVFKGSGCKTHDGTVQMGHPSTFGTEIKGQICPIDAESGPSCEVSTGGSFVLGGRRCGCFDAVMHCQPSADTADTASLPDGRPRSDRFRCGGRASDFLLDERGQRREEIPVAGATLEIGPQFKTLWYEVERQ